MKLGRIIAVFCVAVILINVVQAAEVVNDNIQSVSRDKYSNKRPFYGDQSHPAKSCKEIFKQMPNLPSGVYWLDVYDWTKKKVVQEKHFCQNTFSNETRTGLKFKQQQGEVGIEDLSLGNPDPVPFDWEELTNENWPLPIVPPTEEEMRQRLLKQIKIYRLKMKKKNPGKSGSDVIADSSGTKYPTQRSSGPSNVPTFNDSGVKGNMTLSSFQSGNPTLLKGNVSSGFNGLIGTDNSAKNSSAQNERTWNETDVNSTLIHSSHDANLVGLGISQTQVNENLINYAPVAVSNNETNQPTTDMSSKNSWQSWNNGSNYFQNPKNPDSFNISSAGKSFQNQDQGIQNSLFGENTNISTSSNNTLSNEWAFNHQHTENNTKIQEMNRLNFNESTGYGFGGYVNLDNGNSSLSGSFRNSTMTGIDNLRPDWNSEYIEKSVPDQTVENSTTYDNLTQSWNSGYTLSRSGAMTENLTTSSDQSDSNRYLNPTNQALESTFTLSDLAVQVPAVAKSDWNREYDLNRSFAVLNGNQSLGRFWGSATSHGNETFFASNQSQVIGGNQSSALVNGSFYQNLSDYASLWNRENTPRNFTDVRNEYLIANPVSMGNLTSPLSSDYLKPDLNLNPKTAANSSLITKNDTYSLSSSSQYPGFDPVIIPNNVTLTQPSNLRSDYIWNSDYNNESKSFDLVRNITAADNIRSNQYWNPGYDMNTSSSSQSNASLANPDSVRWDLYWNPGYSSNKSTSVPSNGFNGISDSLAYKSSELFGKQNPVSETVSHSKTAGNRSISAANHSISAGNQSFSAGSQSISSANQSISAANQSISAGNQSISAGNGSLSADNQTISVGKAFANNENVSYEYRYQNLWNNSNSTSSYNTDKSSDMFNANLVPVKYNNTDGTNYALNETASEEVGDLSMRFGNALYEQNNHTSRSAGSSNASYDAFGRRRNLGPESHEHSSHGSVRMILKSWSKIKSNVHEEEQALNSMKGTTTVIKLEDKPSLTRKSGSGKEISNKDLERDGLFVKPGLNIGVIETTKDLKNETKRKNTVTRWKTTSIINPINLLIKTKGHAIPGSKRTIVSHRRDQNTGVNIPEDSPIYTGQAIGSSPTSVGDPVKKPNPDELNRGLWTDEAINYSNKANEDFAKQTKYVNKHGGSLEDLIREYNKAREDQHALHDPKNADETAERMKDFFARNKEILSSKGGEQPKVQSSNQIVNATVDNRKQELIKDKEDQANQPSSSFAIGLSSNAGSETGSESQTETWANVGTNAGSFTGSDGGSEPDEEKYVDEASEWEGDDGPDYEEYDQPQGLGLWTDSQTGTGVGVGVSAGANAGADAALESEAEVDKSSKNSWPGIGFSNGFGMGLNAGSQSGSETMTETSVAINSGTSAKTDSKSDSDSESNLGSKSRSRYKWKMGPSTNSGKVGSAMKMAENDALNEEKVGNLNAKINQGNVYHPSHMAIHPLAVQNPESIKEKARFHPNPQLGIQAGSDVNTKVSASASAQSQSGKSGGVKKKPKGRPKTMSQINMEKAKAHLKEQMKKHQEDLEARTRNNPLHKWKLFGKTPLQARLEAIAEKTRNIPLGIRVGAKNEKQTDKTNGKDKQKDQNKVEASVDIKYEGKNTKGVDIEAGVSTKIGGQGGKPKINNVKDMKGGKANKGTKNWRSLYKWYDKYPFNIPSIAEINRKLNSMPYAVYKAKMRKIG